MVMGDHNRDWEEDFKLPRWQVFLALILMVVVLVLALLVERARAEAKGEIPPGVLPMQEKWFHQPRIQACCSKGDGYVINQYEQVGDHYRVPNPEKPSEWIDIPPNSVIYGEGNPTGYAWLWLYQNGVTNGGSPVRCFVPNGDL